MRASVGYVYFIKSGDGGPVKVGWSENPQMRLAQLQSAHHETLTLIDAVPGGRDVEAAVHAQLAESRVRGEWFRDDEALRDQITALRERGRLRPLGLNASARAEHLALMREGWESLAQADTEDEAAEIFAAVGRSMFRVLVEHPAREAA